MSEETGFSTEFKMGDDVLDCVVDHQCVVVEVSEDDDYTGVDVKVRDANGTTYWVPAITLTKLGPKEGDWL